MTFARLGAEPLCFGTHRQWWPTSFAIAFPTTTRGNASEHAAPHALAGNVASIPRASKTVRFRAR